jgi:hypothetical protein
MAHDASKLHLAVALWAEGFTATAKARGGGKGSGGRGAEANGAPAAKKAKKASG